MRSAFLLCLAPLVARAGGALTTIGEMLFGPPPAPYWPTSTRVFASGERGVTCFRIPALVRTASGALVAFAEARHGSCGDGAAREIMARQSLDGGATWGDIAVAAGGLDATVGNPNPIALSSGRVVLLYANHEAGDHGQDATGISMVSSDDDGRSWSKERRLDVGFGSTSFSLPGPGAGIEISLPAHMRAEGTQSKRLLAVSHGGGCREAYILYSDDGAESWHQLNRSFPGMSEGALADFGGGHVLLSMRSIKEDTWGRPFSRSVDGGLTWSRVEYDQSLLGPHCHASVAQIGGVVYFLNPASSTAREKLTIRKSSDGGRTWESRLLLQSNKSYGYTSLVAAGLRGNAHGGVMWEASELGNLDFVVFPLEFSPYLII